MSAVEFFIVLGFAGSNIETEFITKPDWAWSGPPRDYNSRIRVYRKRGQAAAYVKRIQKEKRPPERGGMTLRVLRVAISLTGHVETEWIDID